MLALVIMGDVHHHVDAEDLERYSMGTSPPEARPLFEEHLLTCEGCQDRLREIDAYLLAVRMSSERLRREKKTAKGREWRIQSWFQMLAAVAFGMVLETTQPLQFLQQFEIDGRIG